MGEGVGKDAQPISDGVNNVLCSKAQLISVIADVRRNNLEGDITTRLTSNRSSKEWSSFEYKLTFSNQYLSICLHYVLCCSC